MKSAAEGAIFAERFAGSLRPGKAGRVDLLEIRWPSGQVDTLKDIKPNQVIYVKEAEGLCDYAVSATNRVLISGGF